MTYEYERVLTPSAGLRLHLNENTAGCSPKVIEALQRLSREEAAFYPDYDAAVRACADRLGVAEDQVLLTNGLDEGILATAIAALRGSPADSPYEAIVVVPAFDMYAACTDALGGRVIEVTLGADFRFPLDDVLSAIGPHTKVIFLTNPNNPTGQLIPREALLTIARAAPAASIFVDEAYADFSGDTLIGSPDMRELPNIVVGRTFAKAYGLAALRAGALVSAAGTLTPTRRIVPPYSINACAAIALPVALADEEYRMWYLDQVCRSRELLYAALDRLRVGYWRSAANFVLVNFGMSAPSVIKALAAREIYVRDRSHDPGCDGCVRITTGVVEHTTACINALEEILCERA
jgi:histidinol-phosphate aminotransferase